jgi:hypothetical protein
MHQLGDGAAVWEKKFADLFPRQIAASRDGEFLAVYFDGMTPLNGEKSTAADSLDVFRTADGEKVASYPLTEGSIQSIAFSPDGSRIVTGMELGDALVWEAPRGR